MLTNDHTALVPMTSHGVRNLEFDFPALHIGVAEYTEGPTGCTVFYFPQTASLAVDIRGGDPGFIGDYDCISAICLAGGSMYGKEAIIGVAAELFKLRGYSTEAMALVSGAILYDYRTRDTAIYPDKALGRAALKAARPGIFPEGPCGAGRSASVGKGFNFDQGEPSGQGGAFRQIGPTKIAVFTVVNAIGAIVNRQGEVVRGNLDQKTGTRHQLIDDLERRLANNEPITSAHGNTTLTVVVTNQKLNSRSLRQIGRQVHSSLARAIQPFHTIYDGDVLFSLTTNEIENLALSDIAIGVLASELAWDAVLRCF